MINLVNNLSEEIHRTKCKFGYNDKKGETCGIKYKHCDCFLEYKNFKDGLMEYKCLTCNKSYYRKFDEKLNKINIYKFPSCYNNKLVLLLRIGVYPYECLDDWEKFNETSLPGKGDFYRHLNMEDITNADYAHAKRF